MIPEAADLVLTNAAVLTMDRDRPVATSVAVRAGTVLAVGEDADTRGFVGPRTRVLDAGGRFAMPGFHDSHNHLMTTGLGLLRPGLNEARSVADVLAVITRVAATTAPGEWIETAPGWHENQLAERRFPSAAELDAAAPAHPVVIRRGGHNMVLNSEALRRAGITADATSPAGGTFVRDARGRLTGHLAGKAALAPVLAVVPPVTREQWTAAVAAAAEAYAAAGITAVIDPGLTTEQMAVYRSLAAEDRLTVRTSMMWLPPIAGLDATGALDAVRSGGFEPDLRSPWCRTLGIKLIADGGVETGYYRDHYAEPDDPAHPWGKPLLTPDVLEAVCTSAAAQGWHVGVHVLGDAATDLVLDAFRAAAAVAALPRWTLIHLLNPRAEHWPVIDDLGLSVTAQPGLFWQLAGGFTHYLGAGRARDIGPLAELVRHLPGRVGGGSDSPVAPFAPLAGIATAATRNTRDSGCLGAEWAVDVATMLELYTTGSAWCAGQENVSGTLAPGRFGDFVVLSADPRSVAPADVGEIEVLATAVGGRVVHDRLS
ncbi:amidohydrolase [Amycolatopsis sp. NPDC051903]|uniref:amidohydrolase n=1 Tax=Amycolatopsis sp. NPDC051903 TaxID=3363936 RepID=UPI00379BBFE6